MVGEIWVPLAVEALRGYGSLSPVNEEDSIPTIRDLCLYVTRERQQRQQRLKEEGSGDHQGSTPLPLGEVGWLNLTSWYGPIPLLRMASLLSQPRRRCRRKAKRRHSPSLNEPRQRTKKQRHPRTSVLHSISMQPLNLPLDTPHPPPQAQRREKQLGDARSLKSAELSKALDGLQTLEAEIATLDVSADESAPAPASSSDQDKPEKKKKKAPQKPRHLKLVEVTLDIYISTYLHLHIYIAMLPLYYPSGLIRPPQRT